MNKDILIKYLKNSCTDEEFEKLVVWVQEEAQNSEGKSWGIEHWESFEPDLSKEDKKKYSALLDKIHHQINLEHRDRKPVKMIFSSNITKWLSRAAAILFIPLLGVVFYLLSNGNFKTTEFADLAVDSLEVIAPIGSRTVVQLSDGTEVNLNYGSKIKYPRNFNGERREIVLSGEAFFDVAHNKEKPFVVKTGQLQVKVLGTEFNINAYPDDDFISTTLVKGKVAVEKVVGREQVEQIKLMKPGENMTYNKNSETVTSHEGSIDKYIAWKDGKLIFDDEPITKVAEKLGRMFNVEIEVANDVKDLSYTVTFFNDPLYLILDLMTETTPIKYEVLPRKRQADGTFSKQKIRIERR
ncbi:FecR family protein [Maribellus maritimus]|uniref:FecR family protein n=1 Tax=Maribellus maritimus TaxID=2870838 RepID=UPI001EEC5EEB|nr:FecR domain-containing protein [Maribellus maritimus]MCG6189573.1 FecR domain-containing protein [Maribellus maritimus]